MVDSTRGDQWRIKPNVQFLATLFHSWPGIDYKISTRKMVKIIHLYIVVMFSFFLMIFHMQVFLPYASIGHFVLFCIDKDTRRVCILDPLSISASLEDKMRRTHGMELKFQRIYIYFNDALAIAQPGWNSDIFFWPRKPPVGTPRISSRWLSYEINSGCFTLSIYHST